MQDSHPTRPVSGTLFEAVHVLRPHPKLRPVSAPVYRPDSQRYLLTPEEDRLSWTSSGTTAVDGCDAPRLYTSRTQYRVASSQALGSLGRRLGTPDAGAAEPYSPLSPRSMISRAKALLTPRSVARPHTSDGYKTHGLFCQTKYAVKRSLRRKEKTRFEGLASPDSLRSGFYSALTVPVLLDDGSESIVESEEASMCSISDEPPQIPPLRPVSKFMPALNIKIPKNEFAGFVLAEHGSVDSDSDSDSLHVAPLRLRLAKLTQVARDSGGSYTSSSCAAQETDDVFSVPDDVSETESLITNFIIRLRQPSEGEYVDKHALNAPSIDSPTVTPTVSPPVTPPVTPSPASRLRHTTLQSTPDWRSTSLRSHYSASESPLGPRLVDVQKMRT